MSGKGLARFANRGAAATVTASASASAATTKASTTSTTGAPPSETPAAEARMGVAPAASMDEIDDNKYYGGGGDFGMEDYTSPYGHFEFNPPFQSEGNPMSLEEEPDPSTAAKPTVNDAGANQNLNQAAETVAAPKVAAPKVAAPPPRKPAFVVNAGANAGRPTVSRSWLAAPGKSHPWLSPTPDNSGAAGAKTVHPRAAAAPPQPAAAILPRRSSVLFTPRPANRPIAQLVAAPRAPRAPPCEARGGGSGWQAMQPRLHTAEEGSQGGVGRTAPPKPGENHQAKSAPVSILKAPPVQGRGSAGSDPTETWAPVFTPPPPAGSTMGRGAPYETPVPQDHRQLVPAGPSASTAVVAAAAAVTPSTAAVEKKSVSFGQYKEVFLIPRVLAESGPGALAPSPMHGRESGQVVPMEVPPQEAFDFDAADHAFSMSCREAIDRVKVMTDEVLDLNEYLSIMQADMHVAQANLLDVASDTEGLCRGYQGILKLLEGEFPDEDE